jgi:hypothetical protein
LNLSAIYRRETNRDETIFSWHWLQFIPNVIASKAKQSSGDTFGFALDCFALLEMTAGV